MDYIADCPMIRRLAEINRIRRGRQLNNRELMDLYDCLNWVETYFHEIAIIENLSIAAHIGNDATMQKEVKDRIENR